MTHPEDQPAPQGRTELPTYAIEEEEHTGWRRWLHRQRAVITVIAAAFLIAAIFGAKPLYREMKARRALSIATQAGEALDHGDVARATQLMRQAALMAFQDPRVAALVTMEAARTGDQPSIMELGKKLTAGSASPEEILVLGEASLVTGNFGEAARAADALGTALTPEQAARAAVLRGAILQSRKQTPEAIELLRTSLAANNGPESDRLRIALAKLLLSQENAESRAEAAPLLEQAATNQGRSGAEALRLLCISHAGITPEARGEFERTAGLLRAHPASTADDEILLARIAISADPSRLGEVTADLATRLRESKAASIDTRVAAARWMVGQEQYKEVLDLVSDDDASNHAGAMLVRLDALSGLKEWDKTSTLLEKNRGGTLSDTLYRLFRARLALIRGNDAAANEEKRQLRQVMSFADPQHVLFAARYAETTGWRPEALAAWRILSSNEAARPDALRGQLRNLAPDAPAAEGLAITSDLLALQPDDPSVLLSAAYFQLLANNNDARAAAELAEKFLAANPESPDLRRVAALARLRTGKADQGLAIWPDDGNENRWRAVHVALLRAAGKARAAKIEAGTIDLSTLGPEEKDLVMERKDAPGREKSPAP